MENDTYFKSKTKIAAERKEFLRKITNLNKGHDDRDNMPRKLRTPMVISAVPKNKIGERINLEKLHQKALKQALAEKMLNDNFSSQAGLENIIATPKLNTSKTNLHEDAVKGNIFTEPTLPSNLIRSGRESVELKPNSPVTLRVNSENHNHIKRPESKIISNVRVHYINSKVTEYKEEPKENRRVNKIRTLSSPKVMHKNGAPTLPNNRTLEEQQNQLIVTANQLAQKTENKLTNSPIKTDSELNDVSFTINQNSMFTKRGFDLTPKTPAYYLNYKRMSDPVQFSMGYNSRRIKSFNRRELLKPIQLSNSYNRNLLDDSDFELNIRSLKVADIRKKFAGDIDNSKDFNQTHTGMSELFPISKNSNENKEGAKDFSLDPLIGNHFDLANGRRIKTNQNPRFYVPLPIRKSSGAKKDIVKKKEDISGLDGSDKSSEGSTFREYVMTTGGNITSNVELEHLHKTNILIE